jgi:hypothetical protein
MKKMVPVIASLLFANLLFGQRLQNKALCGGIE